MLKYSNNIRTKKVITDVTVDEDSAVRAESFKFK